MNMSLDEMLFNSYKNEPILRTYCWDNKYTTIGYFQKIKDIKTNIFVRRFTGGLMVNHYNDISYSFIISSKFWDIYDQNLTYRHIHFAIKKALEALNINSIFLDKNVNDYSNCYCLDTFCQNDLILNDRKIVGSCLRRSGRKLIVQGSIHVNLNKDNKKSFSKKFAENINNILKDVIKVYDFNIYDLNYANIIAKKKYSNKNWNSKF
ncbi:MAG: hypothetical protein LBQ07_00400 [Endomicrobium sp.]|nr:hypothetical protein [Endomicrobium sp.]